MSVRLCFRRLSEHSGPDASHDSLYGVVYSELKRIARHHLRTRAAAVTLSTIDLVHQGYLKFDAADVRDRQSRAHFFGSAAQDMRPV